MQYLVLYHKSQQLYNLGFATNNTSINALSNPYTIVTPKPMIADSLREKISSTAVGVQFDVVTINKFIRTLFESHFSLADIGNFSSKSQLFLELSMVWKKIFGAQNFEGYQRAFNLYTELRGVTPSLDLINDFLSHFEENLQTGVKAFWTFVEQLNRIDEQRSYHLLTEAVRDNPQIIENQNFIFWDFVFMNPMQVDLLKALARTNDVYIPFNKTNYEKLRSSDWIHWLDSDVQLELESGESTKNKINTYQYSRGRLKESLVQIKDELFNHQPWQLVLTEKNASIDQINDIPFNNISFKSVGDIFSTTFFTAIDLLEKLFFINNQQCETHYALKEIHNRISIESNKNRSEIDFRELKVFLEFNKIIKDWKNSSIENSQLTSFDFKIICQVVKLNLPRNFLIPYSNSELDNQLMGLENLALYSEHKPCVVCVDSTLQGLSLSSESIPEELIEFLHSIGPVFRPDLYINDTISKLHEILDNPNTVLLIENGILEESPTWSRAFSKDHLDLKTIKNVVRERESSSMDPLRKYISFNDQMMPKKISATSLQYYIDCPRKFYFQYLEKISPKIELKTELLENDLGVIAHAIIEKYFKKNFEWNEEDFINLCNYTLEKHLKKYSIELDLLSLEKVKNDIIHSSSNGIQTLLKVYSLVRYQTHFEYNLQELSDEFSGSIDCMLEGEEDFGLIDFKRGSFSIPTQRDIEKFKKIQLAFYTNRLVETSAKTPLFIGYLCLQDPKMSIFLFHKEHSVMNMLPGKIYTLDDGLKNFISEYNDFEKQKIVELKSDRRFLAMPSSTSSCDFCLVNKICHKGGANE